MRVIDASALVAIMTQETDAHELADRLSAGDISRCFISTVSVWEAACAVARRKGCSRELGLELVNEFLNAADIEPVAPDVAITACAIKAADRYGMGPGYPGILNLGDCFSYATAKHLKARLLFKGDDFGRTDIEPA